MRLTRATLAAHLDASAVTPETFVVSLPDAGYEVLMVILPWTVHRQMATLAARMATSDEDAKAEAAAASPAAILRRAIVDEDGTTPLFDTAGEVDVWLNSLSGADLNAVMDGLVVIQRVSGLVPDGAPAPDLAEMGKGRSTPIPDSPGSTTSV